MLGSCERMASRDAGGRRAQEAADEFVDEGRLARPAGTRDANDAAGRAHGRRRSFRERVGDGAAVSGFDLRQPAGEPEVGGLAGGVRAGGWVAVAFADPAEHLGERGAREKDAVGALLGHQFGVGERDGAAAAAEEADMGRSLGVELRAHLREKFHVAAVVGGKTDGTHVLLHRRAHDLRRRSVVAEVDHFDAVADEFEVDRVDGRCRVRRRWARR